MGKVLKNMPFSFPPVSLCGHLWFTIENKASSPSHGPRITGERSRGDLKLISSPVSSLAQSRAMYLLLCPLHSRRPPVAATEVPVLASGGVQSRENEEREEDGVNACCCMSGAPPLPLNTSR